MNDTQNIDLLNNNINQSPIINQSRPKPSKYKYLFIALALLITIVSFSLILKYIFFRTNLSQSTSVTSQNVTPTPIKEINQNSITIKINDIYKKIDIETANIVSDNQELNNNLSEFKDLPKEYKNSKTSLTNYLQLQSKDKSKIIITSTIYDETAEPSEFDGSLPIISQEDYLCNTSDKTCKKSSLISSIKFNDQVYWSNWDSEKNLLYGHLSGEGIGNASPVYIYNINTKSYQKTVNFDSLKDIDNRASVPTNYLSPSFSKFIMFGGQNNSTILYLFDSNNLDKPQKTIKLNIPGPLYSQAITWFNNENEIAFINEKQIYILDLNTEKLTLEYTIDQTQTEDYSHSLDSYHIALTPNEKYLVFIDYGNSKDYDPNQATYTLKAINLIDGNITDVYKSKESLSLFF